MSSEPAKRKKIDAGTSPSTNAGDGDHRKRRRNRTTQSCLHCHASKRMCDRKRPCGRCTQLGITGLCVYEVDDPSQSVEELDDKTRLQRRVAELEGVIRELKNKPPPRSTQHLSNVSQGRHANASDAAATSPLPTGHSSRCPQAEDRNTGSPSSSPNTDGATVPPRSTLLIQSREGSLVPPAFDELPGLLSLSFIDPFNVATSSSSSSPLSTPTTASATVLPFSAFVPTSAADSTLASLLSDFTNGDPPSDSPFADLFDSTLHDFTRDKDSRNVCLFGQQTRPGECGCLSETANYYAVLELSLRLRRAAEVLSRHPLHGEGSTCLLKQRITDLDGFTNATLGSVDTPGISGFPQAQLWNSGRNLCSGGASPEAGWTGGPIAFGMSTTGVQPRTHVTPSWTPHRHWNMPTSATPCLEEILDFTTQIGMP